MRLTLEARRHADRAIALIRGLPDPDRVQAQLERTDDLLRRSRDRVEECNNDRARILIRTAVEMQMRAQSAYESGRFLAALQLTTGARDRTRRALRLCRIEENLEESAERALQRTDEVISRAERAVSGESSDAARQSLARAVALQARAHEDFRRDDFEGSIQLTQSARAAAFQALRLAGSKS
jgi:predicted S18 family serine protease